MTDNNTAEDVRRKLLGVKKCVGCGKDHNTKDVKGTKLDFLFAADPDRCFLCRAAILRGIQDRVKHLG